MRRCRYLRYSVTALRWQREARDRARASMGDSWIDSGYVITTTHGTPMEPRNFYRAFQNRRIKAGLPQITVRHPAYLRHAAGRIGRP